MKFIKFCLHDSSTIYRIETMEYFRISFDCPLKDEFELLEVKFKGTSSFFAPCLKGTFGSFLNFLENEQITFVLDFDDPDV